MKIQSVQNYYPKSNITSFKGQTWSEVQSGQKLIHQTCFFREKETDKFVRDYVLANFSSQPEINIVSGACSSGEEVYSQLMLLDEIIDKVKVYGFDISDKSIEQAKLGLFPIQDQKDVIYGSLYNSHFMDSYLAFTDLYPLDSFKKETKDKFKKYFTFIDIGAINNEKEFISRNSKHWDPRLIIKPTTKVYAVKPELSERAEFFQADILKLDDKLKDDSVNVFFFKNALYHLLCTTSYKSELRIMKSESPQILDEIIKSIEPKIKSGGLFVVSEIEKQEGVNVKLLNEKMQENGFEQIRANVWRKK